MGYDKPDLGFVVHVGSPPSPVSYYQQVGRAGRASTTPTVVLLPSDADAGVWDYFATATIPDPDRRSQRLLDRARGRATAARPPSRGSRPRPDLRRGRVELMLKQLAVDGAVERVEDGWVATGEPWTYDARALRRHRRRPPARGRHHARLHPRRALPDAAAAGVPRRSVRASRAGGARCASARCPRGSASRPSVEVARAVTAALRGQAHVVEPRMMWPGGEFGAKGRIPAGLQAAPGGR